MKNFASIVAPLVFAVSLALPQLVAAGSTANGQSCFSSSDCASGYCDGATETCQSGGNTTTGRNTGAPTTNTGGNTGGQNVSLVNPLGGGATLASFLNSVLTVVVRIGAIVVVLMLVWVGFLFVTAAGDPGKLSKARQALLYTVIGALILLGAQAIAMGIQATVQALGSGQ